MKKIFGIVLAVISAYLFVIAVFSVVPNDSARAMGYNTGAHLPWIITSIISYFLIKE